MKNFKQQLIEKLRSVKTCNNKQDAEKQARALDAIIKLDFKDKDIDRKLSDQVKKHNDYWNLPEIGEIGKIEKLFISSVSDGDIAAHDTASEYNLTSIRNEAIKRRILTFQFDQIALADLPQFINEDPEEVRTALITHPAFASLKLNEVIKNDSSNWISIETLEEFKALVKQTIEENNRQMNGEFDYKVFADITTRNRLQRIAKWSIDERSVHQFVQEFMKDSKDPVGDLEKIAEQTAAVRKKLEESQNKLENELLSLPKNAKDSKTLKREAEVLHDRDKIKELIDIYAKAKDNLLGTDKKVGIVQQLKANLSPKVIEFEPIQGLVSTIVVKSMSNSDSNSEAEKAPTPNSPPESSFTANQGIPVEETFKYVNALGEGDRKVHTLTTAAFKYTDSATGAEKESVIHSQFTERQLPPVAQKSGNGVKLTIDQFPKETPGASPELLQQARIEFSLHFARTLLANLQEPPSKKNPIVMQGSNQDGAFNYLYSALLILGKETPNFKFDKHAIVSKTPNFDPKQVDEIQKAFKEYRTNNQAIQSLIQSHKDASALKADTRSIFGKMKHDLGRLYHQNPRQEQAIGGTNPKPLGPQK